MRKAKKFLLNAIILSGTSLLVRMVSVSFGVYVANQIGSEGIGVFQLITSIYMFSITVATSGIHLTTTRLVTEELAVRSPGTAKAALYKCLKYSACFSFGTAFALYFAAPWMTSIWLHNRITVRPLSALALSLPPLALSSVFTGYFTALRNATKNASAQILKQGIKIVITLLLLRQYLPQGIDGACLSLVLGDVAAEVFSFLYLGLLLIVDQRKKAQKTKKHPQLTKKMLGICLPIAFSSYVRSALVTIKQVMIPNGLEKSGISCDEAMSQYGLIGGMIMPVIMFPSVLLSSVSTLLIPEISEKNVQHKNGQILHVLSRIFKITLLFSICISGILFAFADQLSLALYHSLQAAPYIRILAPLVTLMYFDEIVDAILKGLNQQVRVVGINILDTIVGIGLIYTILPWWGLAGYIAVIFITETLNALLSIRRLCKVTKFHIDFQGWILSPTICIAISVLLLRILCLSGLTIVWSILLSFVIYLVLLLITGTLKRKDFKL